MYIIHRNDIWNYSIHSTHIQYVCIYVAVQQPNFFFSLGFYMQYYVDKSLIRVLYAAITLPIILILKLSGKNVKIVHNKKGPYKKVQ